MADEIKSSNKYLLLGILIGLVIVYFIFKKNIDNFVGGIFNKGAGNSPDWASCKTAFFAKLPDGKFISVNTTDEGTTGNPVPAYYKNSVTLTQDGIGESGASIKITKQEFDSLCKYKYDPPYAWYTDKPKGNEGHGRTMRMGGNIGSSSTILYDKNGNVVGGKQPTTNNKAGCDKHCLKAYPEGSQFYGYFYCVTGAVNGGYCGTT